MIDKETIINKQFNLKEKMGLIYDILLVIIILFVLIFSISETISFINNYEIEAPNPYPAVLIFMFFALWMYPFEVAFTKFLIILACIFFSVFIAVGFTEINTEQYKNLEKIDKTTIRSFIGDKEYVSYWDYNNIIRTLNKLNNDKKLILQKQEKEQEIY